MPCSCNTDIKIAPDKYCSYCVNKHLVTALTLLENINDVNDAANIRVAAQINLAATHLSEQRESNSNLINICNSLIMKILEKKNIYVELRNFANYYWNTIQSGESLYQIAEPCDFNDKEFKTAVLHVATAIELLKFEIGYENVNCSFAIGQLVLAAWTLMKFDRNLGVKCKEFYNGIENKELSITAMEKFRDDLWSMINSYDINKKMVK